MCKKALVCSYEAEICYCNELLDVSGLLLSQNIRVPFPSLKVGVFCKASSRCTVAGLIFGYGTGFFDT